MSGEFAVRGAVLAALRQDAELLGLVNQVSDGEPAKATAPWLLVGDPAGNGWGARGVDGLSLRQPLLLTLRGDDLARVTEILARIDIVLGAIHGDLGVWRITSLRFERSRITRNRTEWRAAVDYLVRAARLV
ncbi:MAG: DUF3168 domain-containing protein [Sphingomonadales bacterium]|nr:DUF3168 domain-containing protein [Sphingomonadales bacterium]